MPYPVTVSCHVRSLCVCILRAPSAFQQRICLFTECKLMFCKIKETHPTRFAPRLKIRMAFYILEVKLKSALLRLPVFMLLPRIIMLLLLLLALSIIEQILSVHSGSVCNYLCHGSLAAGFIVTTVTTVRQQ